MPDLSFSVEGAAPERFAAAPLLLFKLRVTEAGAAPTPIHAVVLRCQVRIEPARRRYDPGEQERLRDLFGTPDLWRKTLRPMLWTHVGAAVPPFTGSTLMDLLVPCGYDFSVAATKYFGALEGGDRDRGAKRGARAPTKLAAARDQVARGVIRRHGSPSSARSATSTSHDGRPTTAP